MASETVVKVNISTILSIVLMTSSSLLVQVFHYLSPKRSTHITHRLIESMTPEHSRALQSRREKKTTLVCANLVWSVAALDTGERSRKECCEDETEMR